MRTRQIADLVASRFADLGLVDPEAAHGPLRVERRWRYRCVCALPAGHRLAARQVVGMDDLLGQNVISLEREFLSRNPDGAALHDAIAEQLRLQVQQSLTACALVAEGIGPAIVDPFTATQFLPHGVVIRPLEAEIPFETCAIASPEVPLSNAAQRFLEMVAEEFARMSERYGHVTAC